MSSAFDPLDFAIPQREDWLKRVEATLKGADYKKRLVSISDDGIEVDPLGGPWVKVTPEWPGVAPFTRGAAAVSDKDAPWIVDEVTEVRNVATAGKLVRKSLAAGASAVHLRVAEEPAGEGIGLWSAQDLEAVLEGVYLEAVPVRLDAGERAVQLADWLIALWDGKGIAQHDRAGSFAVDPIGTLARRGRISGTVADHVKTAAGLISRVSGSNRVHVMGVDTRAYHAAGATEAQEMAIALATAVAYLRGLEANGASVAEAARSIEFILTTDADVFPSIAKLRAFRRLWARVTEACGIVPQPAWIATESARRMITKRDPWVNMLRVTAATFAAAVGGAQVIAVTPYNAALGTPDDFARRIARNVQLMLQEESGIGRVVDPAGGAWAVERLTDDLATKAWAIFQQIEEQGGIEKMLASGSLQAQIGAAADKRAKDYGRRKRLVTGVSAFPKLDEATAQTAEDEGGNAVHELAPIFAGETTVEALAPRPLAQDFEALRDRSDEILAATGARPRIFLANLGKLTDYNTRATWAKNLFEAGGIEAVGDTGYAAADALAAGFVASGAKIAIICSTDDLYGELAAPAAAALKKAGARAVYLAGRPGEAEAGLREAGVDGFLFEGADVLASLRAAHDILTKTA